MKFLVLVMVLMSCCGVWAVPVWDGEDREKMIEQGWLAGQELLDYTAIPDYEIMVYVEPTAVETALDLVAVQYVPEEHINAYFAKKPEKFLVDPQNLIPAKEREKLERFLQLHADDSEIDLYVYLFDADQSIPSDVRIQELPERLFSEDKPAILVFYFMGSPSKAVMYLSSNMTDVVSIAEQRRARESALVKATQAMGVYEQMEEFLIQISVRAYWMERMMAGTASETSDERPVTKKEVMSSKKKGFKLPEWSWTLKGYLIAAFVGSTVVVLLLLWVRSRRRYTFPKIEVEPRLGAEHAAGVGAVLTFSKSTVSLSEQREQIFEMWD